MLYYNVDRTHDGSLTIERLEHLFGREPTSIEREPDETMDQYLAKMKAAFNEQDRQAAAILSRKLGTNTVSEKEAQGVIRWLSKEGYER